MQTTTTIAIGIGSQVIPCSNLFGWIMPCHFSNPLTSKHFLSSFKANIKVCSTYHYHTTANGDLDPTTSKGPLNQFATIARIAITKARAIVDYQ